MIAVFLAGPAAAQIELEAAVSVLEPLPVATSVEAEFTVTNRGAEPVVFLTRNTPFEGGIYNELGRISRDGALQPYLGIEAKRAAPTADEYVKLEPGDSLSQVIDLSTLWDLSEPGSYEGQFRIVLRDAYVENPLVAGVFPMAMSGGAQVAQLRTRSADLFAPYVFPIQVIEFVVEVGSAITAPVIDFVADLLDKASTADCTDDEETQVFAALDEARNLADLSVGELDAQSESDPGSDYTTWFGDPSGRYAKVKSGFDAIALELRSPSVLHCDLSQCKKDSWFAFVRPADTNHNIYLCKAFWAADLTGTDSRAGTIVHEMSHFTDVADTDDIEYGQSSCRSLATNDPEDAIRNADSHEYFAEGQ